jgi:hypothetical protein
MTLEEEIVSLRLQLSASEHELREACVRAQKAENRYELERRKGLPADQIGELLGKIVIAELEEVALDAVGRHYSASAHAAEKLIRELSPFLRAGRVPVSEERVPTTESILKARVWLEAARPMFTWAPMVTLGPLLREGTFMHAWVAFPTPVVVNKEKTACGLEADRPTSFTWTSGTPTCEQCRNVVAYPLARLLDEVRAGPVPVTSKGDEHALQRANDILELDRQIQSNPNTTSQERIALMDLIGQQACAAPTVARWVRARLGDR